MATSNLSRSAAMLLFVLVVLIALFVLGRQYAKQSFKHLGLDLWALPETYLEQNRQQVIIQRLTHIQEGIQVHAAIRDQLLQEILSGEKSVSGGFVEFRELCLESPGLRHTVDSFYFQDTLDQRIRAYFGKLLSSMSEERPEQLERLRVSLHDLDIPLPEPRTLFRGVAFVG